MDVMGVGYFKINNAFRLIFAGDTSFWCVEIGRYRYGGWEGDGAPIFDADRLEFDGYSVV
jgi:hypothetical protein